MIRRERYCDGRLVKEIEQKHISGTVAGMRPRYVDGPTRWRLDGERVGPVEAEAFRTVWESDRRQHSLRDTARSRLSFMLLGGLIMWLLTVLLVQLGWYGG